ncbi:hypothetical protein KACHI17_20760 [Sediminibacterium sp. KACHI17]|uniref:TolC family protein n=1 Tax=Sediminibacterium sp. KACHI17 TaxID=1751071 RepID=A0AAT9GKT6_9BACT
MKQIIQRLIYVVFGLSIAFHLKAQTRSLTLDAIFQAAASGNKTIQVKLLEKTLTESTTAEVKSMLLPQIFFTSSYTYFLERPVIYLRDENQLPKANPVKYNGSLALDASINASYAITNPVAKAEIASTQIETDKKVQESKLFCEELAFQLSRLFYNTIFLKHQESVLLQSLERNKKALFDAKNLYLEGKALKTDTLNYMIDIQRLENGLSALANQIHINLLQIKRLCAFDLEMPIQLEGDLAIDSDIVTYIKNKEARENLLNERADIKLASLAIQSSQTDLKRYKSMYQPMLMSFAQYQVQSQADNFKLRAYTLPRTSLIGLKLQVPIYAGKRIQHQTSSAKLLSKKRELEKSELTDKAKAELSALTLRLSDEIKQWQTQQKSITAAQEAYQIIYERYQAGLSNRIELSDAELALTKSKLEEKSYLFSIKILETEIKKTLGKLNL